MTETANSNPEICSAVSSIQSSLNLDITKQTWVLYFCVGEGTLGHCTRNNIWIISYYSIISIHTPTGHFVRIFFVNLLGFFSDTTISRLYRKWSKKDKKYPVSSSEQKCLVNVKGQRRMVKLLIRANRKAKVNHYNPSTTSQTLKQMGYYSSTACHSAKKWKLRLHFPQDHQN